MEAPKHVFSAESRFGSEDDVIQSCSTPGPLVFLHDGRTIHSLASFGPDSALAPALAPNRATTKGNFSEWLSEAHHCDQAVELLNRALRYHAWKRGMRFDDRHRLFYFTRSKPKKLWWEMAGKLIQREVTAPHMKLSRLDNGEAAEYQCGWKHEAIRAGFVQTEDGLFLRLEPAWLLTELDGKTPSTDQPVGPPATAEPAEWANERVLQTLRFWSGILAKGHRELRIETGSNPIRVRLTPANSFSHSPSYGHEIVANSRTPLPLADVQLIPELVPLEN